VSARFDGEVAIVTGGAGGIGSATCRKLAAQGARVVVADIDAAGAQAVADEIGATAIGFDLGVPEDVERLISETVDGLGRLDVLVNNAGIAQTEMRDTWDMAEDAWDNVLRVDLRSVYVCSRAAIPAMLAAGRGAIVNVASIAASVAVGGAAYAAAKGGIVSYTRHVGRELASRGVRVNCVSPGFMRSPMTTGERLGLDEAEQELRLQEFGRLVPMRRVGGMDDIAEAILYLASDQAGYITGQELIVDGGYVVR
jgi:NAD(P)-dependent dehydrogenase (short-subunit alcohol dehydrogenase family)